jgi:hypothetical protein
MSPSSFVSNKQKRKFQVEGRSCIYIMALVIFLDLFYDLLVTYIYMVVKFENFIIKIKENRNRENNR